MMKNKKTSIYLSLIVLLLFIFFLTRKTIEEPQFNYDDEVLEDKNIEIIEEELESINFLFFGDLMLDRYVRELISRHGLAHLFSLLEEESFTKDYDYVFANLEGAVTNDGLHYPPELLYDFAFEPKTIAKLKDYNFNIFNLANNHLADQGRRGINETYQNLSDLGFYYFGCRDGDISDNLEFIEFKRHEDIVLDESNCSLIITEKKSRKIGWLGFSIVYQTIEHSLILDIIERAKNEVDFLIISPHWGQEYQLKANSSQRDLARKMIDSGADLIIGHHPHVIQDYENYNGSYIFYSLGNFIFDQYFSPETQEGLAVSIELKADGQVRKDLYKIKTSLSKIEEIIKLNN